MKRDEPAPQTDGVLAAALWSTAGAALLLSIVAFVLLGVRGLLGGAIGGALAAVNLWAVTRIVRGLLNETRFRARWSLLAVTKISLLLSLLFTIVSSGVVPILSLAIGYAALPIGVVVGQLWAPSAEADPSATDKG